MVVTVQETYNPTHILEDIDKVLHNADSSWVTGHPLVREWVRRGTLLKEKWVSSINAPEGATSTNPPY